MVKLAIAYAVAFYFVKGEAVENNTKPIFLRNVLGILVAGLLVLLDQLTKKLAVENLKGKDPIVLINGVLELQYTENRGAAFGIFQNKQIGLIIISVIVLAVVIYFFETTPCNNKRLRPVLVVYVLLIAGAIGNMIDRIRLDYVIDFIYFKLIDFPIFNLADSCVTVGCVLLIVLLLFYYKEDERITGIPIKEKAAGKDTVDEKAESESSDASEAAPLMENTDTSSGDE